MDMRQLLRLYRPHSSVRMLEMLFEVLDDAVRLWKPMIRAGTILGVARGCGVGQAEFDARTSHDLPSFFV